MAVNKGILVVVSGFSGAGKGTIMNRLMEKYGSDYGLSISATTRNPRPGEEHGKHYFFISREEFETMIKEGNLIEYAEYVGNYYGTPKAYVEEQLTLGKSVILEIEMQGALKVKEQFPDTTLLFVTTPNAKCLKERLEGRGTETAEVISNRLAQAVVESKVIDQYDYLVINDKLEESVDLVHELIQNVRFHKNDENLKYLTSSNIDFINNMRNELQSFSKGE